MHHWETRVTELFLAGRYGELAECAARDSACPWTDATAPWLVGGIALTGRANDAEAFLKEHRHSLSPAALAACRYFLAIGYVLNGRHQRARRYLAKNFEERRKCRDARSRFFRNQGLAFYFYYTGRLRKALLPASRAIDAAKEAACPYARMVAAEVKGHLLVLTGNYPDGMSSLDDSARLAEAFGHKPHLKAVQIARANYRARHGRDADEAIRGLSAVLATLSPSDAFGRATILMELARQKLRQGDLKGAGHSLWNARRELDQRENGRFDAALAVRYGELALAQADPGQALMHLDHAAKSLDPEVDLLLTTEMVSRRVRAFEKAGATRDALRARNRLSQLSRVTGDFASRNFLEKARPSVVRPFAAPDLNHRQVRILQYLESHEFVDVSQCKKMFRVSDVTACRDLSALAKRQLVSRVGRARATRYTMAAPSLH